MTDLTARPIRAGPHLRALISDFIFSKGKGYIMRTLKLTFSTSGKSNFTLSIDNAKDALTLETVRQEAAKLIPVLVTRSGAEVKEFIKATVTMTSGAKALKSLNQIKLDATADQLLAAGEAVAHLQSQTLSGIRVIDSYDLADGG